MPSVGIVGGRGYAGEEILHYLARHPKLEIACVASGSLAGREVGESIPALRDRNLRFSPPDPALLKQQPVDAWILAMGNGEAQPFVAAFDAKRSSVVDLSADYRCNADWQYGLTEAWPDQIARSRRIANPGCYATGVQLALWPVRKLLTERSAIAFGVSGYSGAGRKPTPRNDADRLRDNLLPYQLVGHQHELEISKHLGTGVRLLPHVAAFFRGISLTIRFGLRERVSHRELHDMYQSAFAQQPLVRYDEAVPEISQVRQTPLCCVGGLVPDPAVENHWVIVSTLDNLGKGAATQAIQNVNLTLGFEHDLGVQGG